VPLHRLALVVGVRQDDNGNVFVVTEVATKAVSRVIAAECEVRGRKQMYSVEPVSSARRS
jgi:hypothetical protein